VDKIRTIIGKEWAEVFKNRMVLFSVAFLPLIFVAMPLIMLATTSGLEGSESTGVDEIPMAATLCQGFSDHECMQIYMLDIFMVLFMVLPVTIPATIAAYSIVGEKTTRSLEPLLATPITTRELLTGKVLAAAIPAVAATWISFLLYATGARFMVTDIVFDRVLDPMWLIAVFALGPLLSLMAVSIGVMISSRVSDPRVAEQLSALVILPIVLFVVGQSFGLFIIDRTIVLLALVVVLFLDAIAVTMTLRVFQREKILTQWR